MNTSIRRRGTFLVAAILAATIGLASSPVHAKPPQSDHDRIVAFWTKDRVAKAVPRDFVYDPATQKFKPAARGVKTGGVTGASWTKGGAVLKTTGKVLFAMGGSYYVCSASVVNDSVANRSIILTAGHCAYDETNSAFATNWMFVPDYDSAAVSLTTSGSFCANTSYGCWTASALVVAGGFANAGGFNDQAVVHDYAFAVVGVGGKSGQAQLDATVGGQNIQFSALSGGQTTYLFGYPASGRYKGKDLVYSMGALGFDPNMANATYRVTSNMTGGCSGGPWFSPFTESTGAGTMMSVNSYGYSGVTAMHGPKLNGETQSMFAAAGTVANNTIYP